MQEKEKNKLLGVFKFVFIVIAVTSLMFVFYNIGLYTNDQEIEVSAEIK